MYAILSETKETIALKKKQIEEKQNHINAHVHEQGKLLTEMNNLKCQVEMLESDFHRLEKQVLSKEEQRRVSQNEGCCVGISPRPYTGNHLPEQHPQHPQHY